jgi:hypothetical protein
VKKLVLALLLVPALASAQGISTRVKPAIGRVAYMNRGLLLSEDLNTVSHFYWTPAGIADTHGVAWTANGTIPIKPASLTRPAGAGVFSDANFYSTTLIADVFDFAGDFTCTMVMQPTTTGGNQMPIGTGLAGTNGFGIQLASGTYWFGSSVPTWTTVQALSNASSTTSLNVLSWGRAGGNVYIKYGTTAQAGPLALAVMTSAAGVSSLIGKYPGGAQPFLGTVYEGHCTTTAYDLGAVGILHSRLARIR